MHSVHFGLLSIFCSFLLFSLIFCCFLIFQCILSTLVFFLSPVLSLFSLSSVMFFDLSISCSFLFFPSFLSHLLLCFLIFQCILSTLVFFLSPVLSLFSLSSSVMFFDLSVHSVHFGILSIFCSFPLFSLIFCYVF